VRCCFDSSNCRHVDVGDMVVTKKENIRHVGVVHKIVRNKWGHKTAFLTWTPKAPPHYSNHHGMAGVNIHNLRRDYDVFKKNK